jgi:uncharacterized membrane protein
MTPCLLRSAAARLALGLAMVALLAGCGSSTSGTVAQQAENAVSTAKSHVETKTTDVIKTTDVTVTEPAQTHTVTETATAAGPTHVTSINNTTTAVAVVPTTSASADATSDSATPWWVWVLIALGVAAIALAIFLLGRRHGERRDPPDPTRPPTGELPR